MENNVIHGHRATYSNKICILHQGIILPILNVSVFAASAADEFESLSYSCLFVCSPSQIIFDQVMWFVYRVDTVSRWKRYKKAQTNNVSNLFYFLFFLHTTAHSMQRCSVAIRRITRLLLFSTQPATEQVSHFARPNAMSSAITAVIGSTLAFSTQSPQQPSVDRCECNQTIQAPPYWSGQSLKWQFSGILLHPFWKKINALYRRQVNFLWDNFYLYL